MVFDVYGTEEEALASFGWTGESRSPSGTLCALATDHGTFKLLRRQFGDVVVLDLSGRFVRETAPVFREQMQQLQNAYKKILLNFDKVICIDAGGLNNWITAHQAAALAHVQLKYILNPRLRAMLDIMKLVQHDSWNSSLAISCRANADMPARRGGESRTA